ncbi:unnamed protein product [Kuraishia capsulata CBS 1993]|uniref:Major facilitator superfamily (MFS) profile domain-containing protein n=1 Tax=Kuraishia capsulata CBS 1993 TaxID=1382522 RepID=W6MTT5_9ASCO|nr:uncharacterized protein KUCA_T00004641001 [Kuraishia capsulata CBS 1993]CDK28657.1 unnamed protein product [Kuraishia capsulata CBS 1993]
MVLPQEDEKNITEAIIELSDAQINQVKYARFTESQKRVFVLLLAIAAFQGPMASTAFLPAVQSIAEEFHTTGTMINSSNAVFCVAMAIAPCFFSPYIDFYGKKPIFFINSVLVAVCSLLVAVSQNLAMFWVFRIGMGFFGTCFVSLAGACMPDIYPVERRGRALSWCLTGVLTGPGLAPVLGGIIITWSHWRVIFWVQTGLSCLVAIAFFIFFKETGYNLAFHEWQRESGKRFKLVVVNPFRVIVALRISNLALIGYSSVALMYNMFNLLTPIRYVVDPRFNLTSPVYGSLFYLAPGMGYLTATFFSGKWSDYILIRQKTKRNGKVMFEDRLKAAIVPFAAVPPTILIYGWSLQKEKGGMALPIVAMFLNGFSQTMAITSTNAYVIESYPPMGSRSISSNYFVRYLGTAVGTASALPAINAIGVGWNSTITAFVVIAGLLCVIFVAFRGEKSRLRWMEKHSASLEQPV